MPTTQTSSLIHCPFADSISEFPDHLYGVFPGLITQGLPPQFAYTMRWDTSRWSTNPYYALVITVIACGGIPKGMVPQSIDYLRLEFLFANAYGLSQATMRVAIVAACLSPHLRRTSILIRHIGRTTPQGWPIGKQTSPPSTC